MQVNAFGLARKSGKSALRFGRLLILIVKGLVGGMWRRLSKSLLLIVKERLRAFEECDFLLLSFSWPACLSRSLSEKKKLPAGGDAG